MSNLEVAGRSGQMKAKPWLQSDSSDGDMHTLLAAHNARKQIRK